MRAIEDIPEQRSPLFAGLLGRTRETGLEGQVARVLANDGVHLFVLELQDLAQVNLARGVSTRELLMPVANLSLFRTMRVTVYGVRHLFHLSLGVLLPSISDFEPVRAVTGT